MKPITLHRVSWSCPDEGNRQEWFTTWGKAMRFARRHDVADEATFDQVELPRTKAELCEWLNCFFRTDNG